MKFRLLSCIDTLAHIIIVPLNFLIVFIHISEISRTVGKMMRTKGLSKMQEESLLWLGKLITYSKNSGFDLVKLYFLRLIKVKTNNF